MDTSMLSKLAASAVAVEDRPVVSSRHSSSMPLPEGVTFGSDRTYRDLAKSLSRGIEYLGSLPHELKVIEVKTYGKEEESYLGYMERNLLLARRLAVLEWEFNVVILDDGATRRTGHHGGWIDIPLIFTAKLPLSPVTEIRHKDFSCKAQTPHPPMEAQKALLEHESKFDHIELWWVPKNVEVTLIKDPILVGCVRLPGYEVPNAYFEIFRWVDEVTESSYWAKEGY